MSSTRPADPSVLDAASLARLRELDPDGRHGVVARVLGTFEASIVRMQLQLREALARDDTKMLGAVAHTLKSSSASVGALALSSHCAAVELAVREGRHDDAAAGVEALLAESERALGAVRAMLGP